jgi:hypothetical protein
MMEAMGIATLVDGTIVVPHLRRACNSGTLDETSTKYILFDSKTGITDIHGSNDFDL